jgi:hypothetical protein
MPTPRRWDRVADPSIRVARLRLSKCGMVMVLVGIIPRPVVGVVAGIQEPAELANGMGDGFHRIGDQIPILVRGVPIRGRGSPLTGSGVRAAEPLIIRSQIGEARLGAGVIRSR